MKKEVYFVQFSNYPTLRSKLDKNEVYLLVT